MSKKLKFLTQRQGIDKYCEGTTEISIGIQIRKGERRFRRYLDSVENFDLNRSEVYRSISFKNGNVLFCLDLDDHTDWRGNPYEKLKRLIDSARKVNKVYPGEFHYKFSGRGLHAIGVINFQDAKTVGIISRYGTVFKFYKAIKNHLNKIINFGKLYAVSAADATFIAERGLNRSTGSYNIKSGTYCIPIKLDWSVKHILNWSKRCKIYDWGELPNLKLRKWTHRINPDTISYCSVPKINDPEPVDWERYPSCVQRMSKLKKKGCTIRWDLMRYWLWLHNVKDAKYLYDTVLKQFSCKEEELKTKYGNDKKEFRHAVIGAKTPPTCNTQSFKKYCDKNCKFSSPYEPFGLKKSGGKMKRIKKVK